MKVLMDRESSMQAMLHQEAVQMLFLPNSPGCEIKGLLWLIHMLNNLPTTRTRPTMLQLEA
jgi:hypothetical protein